MLGYLRKFDEHSMLVRRMADTVGLDVGEAVTGGRLNASMLRNAVIRCMGCERTDACHHWLAAHADGAEAPPVFCRNREVLMENAGE